MTKLPLIIDTDPGIDDAMMLTLAFANEQAFDVRLVTTCSGNISQDKTNYNARSFLSYIGANVEIARGLEQPIFRELEVAEDIHGESGFGNVQFPAPTLPVSKRPAITAMLETIMASNEKMTIVATGPLTNVAALLLAHPEVKPKIERISWMGGAAVGGNMSPSAEFNAYVDPHAVEIVFRSGVPVVMSGLDVTHKAFVTIDEAKSILAIGTEFAEKAYHLVTYYLEVMKRTPFHEENYDQVLHFHDVCAVMYLLRPELFEGQDCYVEVALEGLTAGATVVDYTSRSGKKPNVHVLHTVNREEFVAEFVKAVEVISDRLN
ncbi:ribosylpyrimidine nucleosidase [Planococcus sp. PAMC 21323]|uniref:nucleoside hydrolase n=1 Tax=Planococcus sp. PAMC 21323 TaxID=1526927 RepID=UPI00056F8928|nr:nucleoside hydrolase [Planococcus sp. PAMC 21323]AIY06945.1 ribosylpyrimidine nucleosidase [Planococcus sp. PAMC 21323]